MQECDICGDEQLVERFQLRRAGRDSTCVACWDARAQQEAAEKLAALATAKLIAVYSYRLRAAAKEHGHPEPTREQIAEALRAYPDACEICGTAPEARRLALDHCHDTGRLRGWLCGKCNAALGFAQDRPLEWAAKADAYLNR